MSSRKYFNFVRNCWRKLSTPDQERMAELWKGYEQAVAAAYQKYIEARFGISIEDIFTFRDERWLPYTFDSSSQIIRAATYRTNQDLSVGINLQFKYLIRVGWDDNAPVEIDLRTTTPELVTIPEIVEKINLAVGFTFAKSYLDALIDFTSPTVSLDSKISFYPASDPAADASEFVLGLADTDLPKTVPDFPNCYEIPYPDLVSLPLLQDAIRDDSVQASLTEGTDYVLDGDYVCFSEAPPEKMWSRRNLFNDEWPWNNFGFLMGIYQENSARYVEVLQGLWFAFWTGPRPKNLQRALYLLFGLPTSPFDGTVTAVSSASVTVTDAAGISVSFDVPSGLNPVVTLGQQVEVFDPLVDGIDVFDKVNLPGFIRTEIGRFGIQRFLTENASTGPGPETDETRALRMLEEYTFLPQISVEAFVTPDINIGNIRLFLDSIKPITKTYLFQVIVGEFEDPILLEDRIAEDIDMDVTPSIDYNETNTQPQSVLDAHEITPIEGLSVDTEGILFQEALEVEVRSFGVLIDLFQA